MGRSTRKSMSPTGNGSLLHNRNDPAEAKAPASTGSGQPFSPATRSKHLGKAGVKSRLEADIFPECTPFLVLAMTVAFRVHYVIQPQNWWMVHPNEVYQSLEVAHIRSYGYGYRSYEFSPYENSSDVTEYRQQELQAGMYALQSPIFPYFYVMVTSVARVLGAELHPYLLWRVAHAVVASFLPLAVSRHVVKICQSKDVGSIAAILVASSVHLNILGTHCFLHSFLSPVNFWALSIMTDLFSEESPVLNAENFVKSYGPASNGASSKHKDTRISNGGKLPVQNTYSSQKCLDINGSHDFLYIQKNVPTPKPAATPGSATIILETTVHPALVHFFKAFTSSFILSLACYISPDVCILVLIHVCLIFSLRAKPSSQIVSAIFLGSASAFLVGAGADYAYYGRLELSPVNWFSFHVVRNLAMFAFGQMGTWTYVDVFFLRDFGTLMTSVCSVAACCVLYLKLRCKTSKREQSNSVESVTEQLTWMRLALKALASWVVLFFIYSMSGCEETQFTHDCAVAVLVFIAVVMMAVRSLCRSKSNGSNLIRCLVLFFVVSQWQGFTDGERKLKWVHERTPAVEDTNQCLHFISSQNDVTAVFIDHNILMTGATTLLRHDVTIMYFGKGGYYEFGPESRKNYTSDFNHSHLHPGQDFFNNMTSAKDVIYSINEFTRASNYISESNAPAVASVIMLESRYNYLLLRVDRRFVDYGFEEVFATGQMRVLRRKGDPMSEHKLQLTAEKLPTCENSSVILQEAGILFSMSQWAAAASRYQQAIHLDEQLVDAYPPLATCFTNIGNHHAARNVKGRCWSLFGQEACATPTPIMNL